MPVDVSAFGILRFLFRLIPRRIRPRMMRQSIALLLLVLFGAAQPAAWASQDAQVLIKHTADEVLEELRANEDLYRQDPDALEAMMRRVVVPRFDMERITRWILGKWWQDASDQDRARFQDAFTSLLLRTYATALKEFDGDRDVTYLPVQPSRNGLWVTVPTKIQTGKGESIGIDYRVGEVDGNWRVLDVQIDGISLVRTYRQEYAGIMQRSGVDGLIEMLQTRNEAARIPD